MNTETRRASSRAYHAKRQAEGLKKVTLWLSPAARFKLDALKAAAGSKDKAANDAILAWPGPDGPKEAQPVTGPGLVERVKTARQQHEPPNPTLRKAPKLDAKSLAMRKALDALPAAKPAVSVSVPLLTRPAFNPQQKKGGKK